MASENFVDTRNTNGERHIDLVIKNIQNLIDKKLDFQAFIVISIGIEFLGSFTDSYGFDDFGCSRSRFENSLDHWFSEKKYKEKKTWLYENLRGPLIHQYRPGKEILLTSKCNNNVDISRHWEKTDTKIIFVLEKLFADFKLAVERLKREFSKTNGPYKKTKMEEKYLSIFEMDNWDNTKVSLSGHSNSSTFSISFPGKGKHK